MSVIPNSENRNLTPKYRAPKSDKWVDISWDEALDKIASKIKISWVYMNNNSTLVFSSHNPFSTHWVVFLQKATNGLIFLGMKLLTKSHQKLSRFVMITGYLRKQKMAKLIM